MSMFEKFFNSGTQGVPQQTARKSRARRSARYNHLRLGLRIEELEDRCLLSGGITEFPIPGPIPTANRGQELPITAGPDGNIWFAEDSGNPDGSGNLIGRVNLN